MSEYMSIKDLRLRYADANLKRYKSYADFLADTTDGTGDFDTTFDRVSGGRDFSDYRVFRQTERKSLKEDEAFLKAKRRL